MNTEHLAYILEAYKCGSVNKAAKNCYISQSTLSSIIKNVEDEIGYPLFRRTRTGLSPTPEGEVFMTHAEKIIIERRNIQRIPESMAENNNLSIICARSAFVLQCFFDFKKHFPCENSHDAFLEAGLRENLRTVVAQKCRVGIMVLFERVIPKYIDLADQYNLDFKVLKRSIPASVMHAKTHPIAQKKEVTLADLAQHPFVADAHIDYDDTLAILGLPDKHNFYISATVVQSMMRSAKAGMCPSASAFRPAMPLCSAASAVLFRMQSLWRSHLSTRGTSNSTPGKISLFVILPSGWRKTIRRYPIHLKVRFLHAFQK